LKLSRKDYNTCRLYVFLIVSILVKTTVLAQDKIEITWEIPKEIQVTTIEETVRSFDSIILQTKNHTKKASILQQRAQVLLQEHRIKEAKKTYELAIQTASKKASDTKIKILAGLGK